MNPLWQSLLWSVLYLLQVHDPAGYQITRDALALYQPETPIIIDGRQYAGWFWLTSPTGPHIYIDPHAFDDMGDYEERTAAFAAMFTHEAQHWRERSLDEVPARLRAYVTVSRVYNKHPFLRLRFWQILMEAPAWGPNGCETYKGSGEAAILATIACANLHNDRESEAAAYARLPQPLPRMTRSPWRLHRANLISH